MGISFVILKFPTYLNAPSIAYDANGRGIPVPIMDTNWKKTQKTRDCWGLQGREAFLRCSEPHFLWVYAILRCSVRMYFVKYCTCDVTAIVPFFPPWSWDQGTERTHLSLRLFRGERRKKNEKRNTHAPGNWSRPTKWSTSSSFIAQSTDFLIIVPGLETTSRSRWQSIKTHSED